MQLLDAKKHVKPRSKQYTLIPEHKLNCFKRDMCCQKGQFPVVSNGDFVLIYDGLQVCGITWLAVRSSYINED